MKNQTASPFPQRPIHRLLRGDPTPLGEKDVYTKERTLLSMVSNSYWMTNFYVTKAAKVSVRHRLSAALPLANLTADLWTFPCVSSAR
jgi:hypothetical protein